MIEFLNNHIAGISLIIFIVFEFLLTFIDNKERDPGMMEKCSIGYTLRNTIPPVVLVAMFVTFIIILFLYCIAIVFSMIIPLIIAFIYCALASLPVYFVASSIYSMVNPDEKEKRDIF